MSSDLEERLRRGLNAAAATQGQPPSFEARVAGRVVVVRHRRAVARGAIGVAAIALAACGAPPADPSTLLRQAKQAVDSAPSAHFDLTSSPVKGSGPFITGGSGDMKRPNSFTGSLNVDFSGLALSIQVVAIGGVFYAQLPTSTSFQKTDPTAPRSNLQNQVVQIELRCRQMPQRPPPSSR